MFHEVLGVLLILLIPLGLLALLFVYLRRTAPEGSVVASEVAPALPTEEVQPVTEGPGSRVQGARKCKNCGMVTTAAMIGGRVPRCQNCNAMLTN